MLQKSLRCSGLLLSQVRLRAAVLSVTSITMAMLFMIKIRTVLLSVTKIKTEMCLILILNFVVSILGSSVLFLCLCLLLNTSKVYSAWSFLPSATGFLFLYICLLLITDKNTGWNIILSYTSVKLFPTISYSKIKYTPMPYT